MNKQLLLEKILIALEAIREQAASAAMEAYKTATADENVAENKYDTLGLEASYLAHGQAQRVAECEEDIAVYKLLAKSDVADVSPISLGALIHIVNEQGVEQKLFLGPKAGGLTVSYDENCIAQEIKIVTPSSPIGTALLKREEGDEFELTIGPNSHSYEILNVC
jgi:transcription elongation GreA/GreB family factor